MNKRPHETLVRRSILLSIISLLCFTAAVSAQGPTRTIVSWDRDEISQTLGNGAPVAATEIHFTVSSVVTGASIFITPEVGQYVSLDSTLPATLEPNTQYSIQLSYSLPPNAVQGLYEGTIHVRSRSRTVPRTLHVAINLDFEGNAPSSSVRTLSPDTLALISGVTQDGKGIYFSQSNDELSNLVAGNILALPPASHIPNGFFGQISSITPFGAGLFIQTVEASLSDAFTNAHVTLDKNLDQADLASSVAFANGVSFKEGSKSRAIGSDNLTASLNDLVIFDQDGSSSTTNDQVLIDGSVTVDPNVHFSFDIDDGHLDQLAFTIGLNQSSEVTVKSRLQYDFLDAEREFGSYRFGTIVIWVGWVPVVIVPEATLVAKATGSASVGVEAGISQAAIANVGFGYSNGSWHPISEFSNSFNFNQPTFSAGIDIKGQAGPRFKLLLYGIIGPRADLTAYVEFDVDIFRTPVWQLWGGLEASAGVRLEIFDHTIADQDFPFLLQQRILLAEGGVAGNGSIVGVVRDAVSGQGLGNATITVFRDGSLVNSLLSGPSGDFTIQAIPGAVYRLRFTRSGYLPATYENITVLPSETHTLDVILQISEDNAGDGTVSGRVVNALSGAGVSGLTMNLRLGINASTGPVVATTTTGANGTYSISNLPAGNYTAEVSGAGYSTAHFSILCIGNTTSPNQNGVISPILPENQIRIVLTWGATPSDLDSHFFGPLEDGTRFHMYYPYSGSSSPWPTIVNLDLDDVTSFGPETTTLYQQIDGVYKFSVHDYTNRNSATSSALSNSGAQVRVYKGSNLIANFNVPLNQPATLWEVFELEGDTIRPLNNMLFSNAPTSFAGENAFEAMPEKR